MEAPKDPEISPDTQLNESDQGILFRALGLTGADRFQALSINRSPAEWTRWAGGWLGAIGGTFFLLGILFFFASNWREMSPPLRLGVLQASVGASVIGACLLGIRSAIGRWLLLSATVLTGVLFAVFGQVYQTGADSYEVFALWAALSLIWVILSQHAPLWTLWIVIAQAALSLWGGQVIVPDAIVPWEGVFILLAIFNIAFLVTWEMTSTRENRSWLPGDWFRVLLVIVAMFWISACPFRWIFDFFSSRDLGAFVIGGTVFWLAATIFGIYFYQSIRLSIGSLSACLFSLGIIIVCAVARILLEVNDSDPGTFLLIGLISVGVFSGIATWIIRVTRAQNPQSLPAETDPANTSNA